MMSRLGARGRKRLVRLAIGALLLASVSWMAPGWFLVGSRAASSNGGVKTVAKGAIGPRHWFVGVTGDGSRRGVCLEAIAYLRRSQNGGPGNGRCAAPSIKRGSTVAVVEESQRGRTVLTVLGAAFSLAVASVQVKTMDGRSERLQLRRVRGDAGSGYQVGHFKYAAKAVAGPWCVSELVARNEKGAVLWRAFGWEVLPYYPAKVCS
jgi:hypothetical protein